jgi:hypothetical protein
MPWANGPLTVYHGTIGPSADSIANGGVSLRRCRARSDFARGFYMTPNYDQARSHANTLFSRLKALWSSSGGHRPDPVCAAILTYEIDRMALAQLSHLAFVSPTSDWSDFVLHCRATGGPHAPTAGSNYDVVYGPVQQLNGKAYPPNYEQVSFHSATALTMLQPLRVAKGTPLL